MENANQVPGNVIDEPLHSDFLSDASSDASLTRSDMSYDTASERKLSDSDKRVRSKLKKGTLKSNGAAACTVEDTVISSADTLTISGNTLLTELSSKDAPLGNKVLTTFSWLCLLIFILLLSSEFLMHHHFSSDDFQLGTGIFTSSFEVNKCQDSTSPIYAHAPSTQRNHIHQPHKVTGEARNMLKPRCTPENSENGASDCETGTIFTSEVDFSSSIEASDLNFSSEDASIRGSIMYKRPPYTLGFTTPLTQKSEEKIPRDCWSQGAERNAYMDDGSSRLHSTCSKLI